MRVICETKSFLPGFTQVESKGVNPLVPTRLKKREKIRVSWELREGENVLFVAEIKKKQNNPTPLKTTFCCHFFCLPKSKVCRQITHFSHSFF